MKKIGIILTFVYSGLFAQEQCGTMLQDSINRIKYPSMGSMNQFEQQLQQKIDERRIREENGRMEAELITIPVVVHVVHSGEPVGSGKNISYEQILSQFEVLNEDFRRLEGTPGFNDHPEGADIEIEFCPSPVDADGNELAEPGVNRYNGGQEDWSQENIEGFLKPTTIFNPDLFLNVWVVNFDQTFPGLQGYAQFPDNSGLSGLPDDGGSRNTDGVVVVYTAFGSSDKGDFSGLTSPTDKGRTLTHEIGHWLGLRHTWGDGDCSADDFCDDTPLQNGSSSGCPIGKSTCGSVDMIENYMDYTNDVCQNIFTRDQKARMLTVMEISPRRNSLLQNAICTVGPEAPPVANFAASPDSTLKEGTVSYKDLSSNFPDTWNWTFEGGIPGTSTSKNPEVTYTEAGAFDVTLIVSNEFGSDTLFAADYMKVSNEGICNDLTNFDSEYSQEVLPASVLGDYEGYLTGHNNVGIDGISEYFSNPQRYSFISGVEIRFGYAFASDPRATLTINVWNGRGVQGAPAAVIERKEVPFMQIMEDIEQGQATRIIFDRETPVFNSPFHVGVELDYSDGDTIAIMSSNVGEANKISSWKRSSGVWASYAIDLGINPVLDINPIVGMRNSVQVSASRQVVGPRTEVTLQARGASIFVWNSEDGSVQEFIGPQLKVRPEQTTTYLVRGSGLDLCDTVAAVRIYVTETTGIEEILEQNVTVFPNPVFDDLTVGIGKQVHGEIELRLINAAGRVVVHRVVSKDQSQSNYVLKTADLSAGIYFLHIENQGQRIIKKFLKR